MMTPLEIRDVLRSISAGWGILLLLGVLLGLSKLRMLPPELGFSGSGAILLASYFLLRDVFELFGRRTSNSNHDDSTGGGTASENGQRRLALDPLIIKVVATAAVLLFVGSASIYRAGLDARLVEDASCSSPALR